MFEIKACTVCLSNNVKLINMDTGVFRRDYNTVSGLKTYNGNGLPAYLCIECAAYIKRFIRFRNKCQRAYYTLLQLLETNHEITEPILNELNRNTIKVNPTLSYLDATNPRVKFESVKFKWVKESRTPPELGKIAVLHYSTLATELEFDVPIIPLTNESKQQIVKTSVNEPHNKEVTLEKDDTHSNDYFDETEIDNTDISNCLDNGNGDDADGSNLDEEYATVVPISMNEARAAVDIYKLFSQGKSQCEVCGKSYFSEAQLKVHKRMHDTHISGKFFCELCSYYYKTEFQLKSHITGKHMYKYICRKCPEVSFDRTSAKQHFIWTHLQKGAKKDTNWFETKPLWAKGKKPAKRVLSLRPIRRSRKLPSDFLVYSPISQKEQYEIVQQRRFTKNYLESPFKCNECYRGFRESTTYENHMKKHDPDLSGKYQCDACKVYVVNTRQMYKHMTMSHIYKYSCQHCSYTCFNRGQAKLHYRWHKNVTYSCPHCDKEFMKASTRLTHIRIKHPSTFICTLCGHSFVSETGLYCHKKIVHTKEEIEAAASAAARADSALYCGECALQFHNEAAFATHFGSSNKHAATNLSIKPVKSIVRPRGRPRQTNTHVLNTGISTSSNCEICKKFLSNDVQARKHYETEHPGTDYLKRYMCDICGHTTRQHANLMVHMRTHTLEKPYACPHCERRFSMPSNRDRHLVVHTGEKRFECHHCNRRFTQSSAVKLHIQTVHLKIPYAPWDKKNRKRKKDMETAVSLPKPDPQGDYINAYMFNL